MMAQALSDPGPLRSGVFFGAGLVLGFFYFLGLWWNSRQLADGRLRWAMLLAAGRFLLLSGVLTLAGRGGRCLCCP